MIEVWSDPKQIPPGVDVRMVEVKPQPRKKRVLCTLPGGAIVRKQPSAKTQYYFVRADVLMRQQGTTK